MINIRRSHISINRVSNREEFIQKAQCVHGDKYDYSLVEYISTSDKVKIRCFKHNFIFEQVPNSHLRGSNCPLCARENTTFKNRLTQDEFINRSSVAHKNKYDYSLAKYEKSDTKVEIICPKHGAFKQSPSGHLYGKGCEKCAHELTPHNQMTTELFIEKANKVHNFRYNYSSVDYKKSNIKVRIICPTHGPFDQTPNNHIMGMRCMKCGIEDNANKRRSNTQEFINKAVKIHGDKYDYSLVAYEKNDIKVKIICPKSGHGLFLQCPGAHLNRRGCPWCFESRGEREITLYLNLYKIEYEREKKFEGCKDKRLLPFDFYISSLNTCIEYDGKQHNNYCDYFGGEKGFEEIKKHDHIKTCFCINSGIRLLRIPYKDRNSEIDSIIDKEIITFFKKVA